jgi:hypothetical protein
MPAVTASRTRALLVWALMALYWLGTSVNFTKYLTAIGQDRNYNYYAVYLSREVWLNLPVRAFDEMSHLSGELLVALRLQPEPANSALAALLPTIWEIVVVDFVAGASFWLLVLLAVLFVVPSVAVRSRSPSP